MARKKQESGGGNNAPWLNTFADLMNLLLCFFVLLFALSTVDEEKFEEISISMANSIGVFEGGGASVGTGELISSGMSQLTELDDFFNSMGKTVEGKTDTEDITNSEQGVEGSSGSEGVMENGEGTEDGKGQGTEGMEGSQSNNISVDQAIEKLNEEMAKATAQMYDKASDLTTQNNLGDYIELSMDPEYQYIELTLKGSVLYDSGSSEIKDAAEPILSKVGDILSHFSDYSIEIIGHTDNVPIATSDYKDNNWLSSARALNAAEFLIDQCDIDPDRLKYSGRGEYDPIASNATAEGRAKNRRIEIRIYNQYNSQ